MIVKLLLMLDTDTANADDVDGMGLAGGTRRELGGYSRGGARGQDSRGREVPPAKSHSLFLSTAQ